MQAYSSSPQHEIYRIFLRYGNTRLRYGNVAVRQMVKNRKKKPMILILSLNNDDKIFFIYVSFI